MEQQVLWKSLMMNGSIVMFWRQEVLEKYIEKIRGEGFDICLIDCESSDCLLELGNTLEFPDYYGKNLDAFNDCLSDVIPRNEGIVLVFKNFDKFNERDNDTAHSVLDIIQNNSWRLLVESQKVLMAFLHSNDPQLHTQPVGALPVRWNNEEWLNRSRGV
ncbi:barstar family protein [Paenibacillus chitinolyticus]|uniref:barstar family protein n=1 Tax=Paenibacillus chitinolyticus TaxID=79263 RepID=UPI00295EA9B6|nr:barstar family protein [Paenibacillus chitinolyticus]